MQSCFGTCYLLTIISVQKTYGANDLLSKFDAINYGNLIRNFNFDNYDKINKQVQLESNFKQNADDGYNDSKCVQQFSDLKRSLNESAMWAIKGERNYCRRST